jgi:hypothetical protein
MPVKTVAAEELTNARRSYVFDGPAQRLYVSPDDEKGTARGEPVTLDRAQVVHMLNYGSKFKTQDGATIRTRAQLDALDNPVTGDTLKSGADTVPGAIVP